MDISKKNISEVLRNSSNLIIPFYQREYTWGKEEILRLLSDIMNCKTHNYYLGSLIFKTKGASRIVIDGQQRISTIWLITKALTDKKLNLSSESYNVINKDLDYFEFKTSDLKKSKILENIIAGKESILDKDERETCYFKNYSEIKNYFGENIEKINQFYNQFRKVIVSEVIAEENTNEHILFSQINSTGKNLSVFDLVKNYLFSKINNDWGMKQELKIDIDEKLKLLSFVSDYLKTDKLKNELVRHFISYKTNILVTSDVQKIYLAFLELFSENSEKFLYLEHDFLTAFNDFYQFSMIYKFIISGKDEWINKKYEKSMHIISPSSSTYMALLVDIFSRNSKIINKEVIINNDQENNISKSLLLLEYYKVSREFYGYSEKNITRFIPKLIKDIKEIDFDISYETKLYYKIYSEPNKSLLNGKKDLSYRLPKSIEFESFFLTTNLYKKQKFCKKFLIRIGSYGDKMKIDFKTFSIEHILPTNLGKWKIDGYNEDETEVAIKRETIGNLTLTNYNPEMSNKLFKDKREMLKEKESWVFNKYFYSLEEWNLAEINKRSLFLLEKVKQIWNFDDIKIEVGKYEKYLESLLNKNI